MNISNKVRLELNLFFWAEIKKLIFKFSFLAELILKKLKLHDLLEIELKKLNNLNETSFLKPDQDTTIGSPKNILKEKIFQKPAKPDFTQRLNEVLTGIKKTKDKNMYEIMKLKKNNEPSTSKRKKTQDKESKPKQAKIKATRKSMTIESDSDSDGSNSQNNNNFNVDTDSDDIFTEDEKKSKDEQAAGTSKNFEKNRKRSIENVLSSDSGDEKEAFIENKSKESPIIKDKLSKFRFSDKTRKENSEEICDNSLVKINQIEDSDLDNSNFNEAENNCKKVKNDGFLKNNEKNSERPDLDNSKISSIRKSTFEKLLKFKKVDKDVEEKKTETKAANYSKLKQLASLGKMLSQRSSSQVIVDDKVKNLGDNCRSDSQSQSQSSQQSVFSLQEADWDDADLEL